MQHKDDWAHIYSSKHIFHSFKGEGKRPDTIWELFEERHTISQSEYIMQESDGTADFDEQLCKPHI